MVPTVEYTAQVCRVQAEVLDCRKCPELVKGRASCHKTLSFFVAVLPKVRSALCATSQLPGKKPTDVEDAPSPTC